VLSGALLFSSCSRLASTSLAYLPKIGFIGERVNGHAVDRHGRKDLGASLGEVAGRLEHAARSD